MIIKSKTCAFYEANGEEGNENSYDAQLLLENTTKLAEGTSAWAGKLH